MLRNVSESALYRDRLVASLRQSGTLLSASVADAFSAIPRELFIPSFYEHTEDTWTLHYVHASGERKRDVCTGSFPAAHSR
jgi:protein-L-isoaspartate O-methyltransferase